MSIELPPRSFTEFVGRATGGAEPYPYQERIARHGLPDVLSVPTGTGKTLAAVLPWLYRRRHHPDAGVRAATPRRLVYVLPQRALVEQTVRQVETWLAALHEHDVDQHTLMGGVDTDDRFWKTHPQNDAIFIGTQDMVLSRLLMRGYAEPRAAWPMSFGLLHADSQFVFDEVQLMGPGLATSLQLDGLRNKLGTAAPCRSMWMSATLDVAQMQELAPDRHAEPAVLELGSDDRDGPLRRRLEATRRVERIAVDSKRYARELAEWVVAHHRSRGRTLVVLNTVDRAVDVWDAIKKLEPNAGLVLLHSRYRPADRARHTAAAIAQPTDNGTIVVSTQVLEAGMDITSELLVTELAPWSSIVQRAGRCNRDGAAEQARFMWASPPGGSSAAAPYNSKQLAHSRQVLETLDGEEVTSSRLQRAARDLDPPVHAVLRRSDLIDLFDTAPDLSGNDIDVTQWIRDADDRTVTVAWRDLDGLNEDAPFPSRDELCPAPLTGVRQFVARTTTRSTAAQVYDQRTGTWRRALRDDVRPGAVIVFPSSGGGYLPDRGFAPKSTTPVDPIFPDSNEPAESIEADPQSLVPGPWVPLTDHLADVDRETAALLSALDSPGLTPEQRKAAVLAGRYHDLGKAHPTFDASLRRASGDPGGPGPWAKSPGRGQLRHKPRYFRHELVSALMLLDRAASLLDGVAEPDLVVYLALSHHGKVRLSVRGRPDEAAGHVLGVEDGAVTLQVVLPDGRQVEAIRLTLSPTAMGEASLTARALRLRDRTDLGPFRLAYLEAVVRAADWIASAGYGRREP